jgi:NAD(P)-dependent dehydrogenase (short-subunit alcohol dehydrogenase family)
VIIMLPPVFRLRGANGLALLAISGRPIRLTLKTTGHIGRVKAVCPVVIRTPMMERAIERDPRRKDRIEQAHPIGRVGEPEEIAAAVVFLSSDDSSFMIGHSMVVDGGYTAR